MLILSHILKLITVIQVVNWPAVLKYYYCSRDRLLTKFGSKQQGEQTLSQSTRDAQSQRGSSHNRLSRWDQPGRDLCSYSWRIRIHTVSHPTFCCVGVGLWLRWGWAVTAQEWDIAFIKWNFIKKSKVWYQLSIYHCFVSGQNLRYQLFI